MKRNAKMFAVGFVVWLAAVSPVAAQQSSDALTVVSAGPTGEVASLAEVNEIRVVFSEPMVTLGRIPQPVTAPFLTIRPAIAGTLRWSGTTILIFTPDPQRKLPFATHYDVAVAASATAVSGRKLATAYTFAFTTPTVKLLAADRYRPSGRYDGAMQLALRFNQPVRPADIATHTTLRFEPHSWELPQLTSEARARLKTNNPESIVKFDAKVVAAARAASAVASLTFAVATDWDKKRHPPSPDLVVLDITSAVPTESWFRVQIDRSVPAIQGPALPTAVQDKRVEAERTFFVDGFSCRDACDPDRWNAIALRGSIDIKRIQQVLSVRDITDPKQQPVLKPVKAPNAESWQYDLPRYVSLEDAGFNRQPPAHTYVIRLDESVQSAVDGQTLGYNWIDIVENWHERAFTSFGDGHGVWESGSGLQLPFYGRNFRDVTEWAQPIAPAQLMEQIVDLEPDFGQLPPGAGVHRNLRMKIDATESHGVDLSAALGPAQKGLVWAGVREGEPTPNARRSKLRTDTSTIVQVTNLGVNVKYSPQNTLVFVTRLDTGEPVPGVRVSLIARDGASAWSGTTGTDGTTLAGPAPRIKRDFYDQKTDFIVVAEKDGDVAYAGSNWHEGISPWDFGVYPNPGEVDPVLRGSVFSDRGVYRLGEEVHFKAILRTDTPGGITLLGGGTPVTMTLRDSQNKIVDERVIKVNEWSSAEWTFRLPAEGALGTYQIKAEQPKAAEPVADDGYQGYIPPAGGSFLVAAYRRPDFRVDATLGSDANVAGATLTGVVTAKYLFGAAMGSRPVKWTATRQRLCSAPAAISEHFADARFVFAGDCASGVGTDQVGGDQAVLSATGQLNMNFDTKVEQAQPFRYEFEGDVEDVSRQHIAGRASFVVHPAPWYVGVMRPSYFVDQKAGFNTAVIAISNEGMIVPGVKVDLSMKQVQWHSVRRAEGQGFYTWETTREQTDAGSWTVTSAAEPVPLAIALPSGGYFEITAVARDAAGHVTRTLTSFYSLASATPRGNVSITIASRWYPSATRIGQAIRRAS